MVGIYRIYLINFLLSITPCLTINITELPAMLNDFLTVSYRSSKILTFTCWSKDIEKYFQKELQTKTRHASYKKRDLSNLNNYDNFFLDMTCPEAVQALESAHTNHLFSLSEYWLILADNESVEFLNIHFPINSNVYVFENNYYGYSVKKIYSPSIKLDMLNKTFVGYWTFSNGYIQVISVSDQNKDRKLIETDVSVSYVVEDDDTISHLDDYRYKILIDSTTKYNYALLQHLYYLVNASKTQIFRKQLSTKEIAGRNVSGMIDDVKYGIAEIGGNPIQFLSNKVDDFDYLSKTKNIEKKFIFRATPHSYISNVFTLPFDTYVWYSCFGLMVAIFVVAYLVVYWEWKDPVFKNYLVPRFALRPDPVDIFLMEVGSAAQQGFESEPRSNSGRIVFIFTLISFMFLYTSFSANIVALLQSTSERLNTLEHLLDSRIPVGFEENVSMKYFEEIDFETKSRDIQNKIDKPVFYSIEEGVKKIKEEFFAFYADTPSVYKYISDWFLESDKCGLREIPFKNSYTDYWLIMKKHTVYKDIFRAGMQKIHEVGLKNREYRRIYTGKPTCDGEGGNFESVGIADSYGAFMIMAVGVALSWLLFFVEHGWRKYIIATRNSDVMNSIIEEDDNVEVEHEELGPEDLQPLDFAS